MPVIPEGPVGPPAGPVGPVTPNSLLSIALIGIELFGYCAYKLPQISTRPVELKLTSPTILKFPLNETSPPTDNPAFNERSLLRSTSL